MRFRLLPAWATCRAVQRQIARRPGLLFIAIILAVFGLHGAQPAMAAVDEPSTAALWQQRKAMLALLVTEDREKNDLEHLKSDEKLLNAVNALIRAKVDPPDKAAPTPGVADSIALHATALKWLQGMWRPAPRPDPEFAGYIAQRSLDSDFVDRLNTVLASQPYFDPWAKEYSSAASRLQIAQRDQDAVLSRDFTAEEKSELLARNDLPGKFARLRSIMRAAIESLGPNNGEQQRAWSALQGFLKRDIDEQLETTGKEKDEFADLSSSARDAAWSAVPRSAAANDIHARLNKLSAEIETVRGKLFEDSLSPYAMPAYVFETPVFREYLDATIRYQEAVVSALNNPALDSETVWSLNGFHRTATALVDQIDVRLGGVRILGAIILERLATMYRRGLTWGGGFPSAPLYNDDQLNGTIQHLQQFQQLMLEHREHPAMWTASELTSDGRYEWHIGSWTSCQWINADERAALYRQNRMVDLAGYTWLLPEGMTAGSMRKVENLLAAHARIVRLGITDSMAMPTELRDHWARYLKEIQTQKAYTNWSGPPYDAYVSKRKP